ncbi:hypothetical protein Hanom_Chr11g01005671 [Helianthus anomalus]
MVVNESTIFLYYRFISLITISSVMYGCYGSVCIFRGTQWKTAYCAFRTEACFPLEVRY